MSCEHPRVITLLRSGKATDVCTECQEPTREVRIKVYEAEQALRKASDIIPGLRLSPAALLPLEVRKALRDYDQHRTGRAFRHGPKCTKCVRTAERLIKASKEQ